MARAAAGNEKGVAVRIMSRDLVESAATYARVEARSVGRQIEYWARVGKLALQNPRVPVHVICGTLLGSEQVKAGQCGEVDLAAMARGKARKA